MIAPGRRSKCSATSASMRRERNGLGAEAVDVHAHRMRDADRVGDLELAAVGEARGDDVLRDVARGVRRRAVDLRRILARERAAAVRSRAAVGVDDDLAAGEARVAHRAADHELAGRVDVEEVLRVEPCRVVEIACVGVQDRLDDMLEEVGLEQRLDVEAVAMLRREQNALDLDGPLDRRARRPRTAPSPATCRRDGGTGARSPCGPRPCRLASLCASSDRHRHELLGLAGRVAEHHSLVARADEVDRVGVAVLRLVRRRRRPARCRATARRSRRRRRRSRSRTRTWRACTRSRRSGRGRRRGCRRRSRS